MALPKCRVERSCPICARTYTVTKGTVRKGKGATCSVECGTKFRIANRTVPPSTKAERLRANGLLNMRIQRGLIVRPDHCQECGKVGRVDGHHESYAADKKAEVEWLCRSCHMKRHVKPRKQAS